MRLNSFGYGMLGIGWLISLVFLLLAVLVILALIKYLRQPTQRPGDLPKTADSALAVLNERYARGEIDSETYERMKAQLAQKPH
jgi:putative membrane protein